MGTQSIIHHPDVVGVLSTFDRMLFRGDLTKFRPLGALRLFLGRHGVLMKDFARYATQVSGELKAHAQQLAAQAGRPYEYIPHSMTAATGHSKEECVRAIAARDGVTEGLVCVLATLELGGSFELRKQKDGKLELIPHQRKCLHFYFYYMDPEFGFMHIRLQSWFPFQIQVYVNGHEWLARAMDRKGIGYQKDDNCFPKIEDLEAAQALCEDFAHYDWPPLLNALARRVNCYLPTILEGKNSGYYWVLDQCEYATDVMFRDRNSLVQLFRPLVEFSIQAFGAEDVLRFLGRKAHANLKAEVGTHLKGRPECCRVKHRLARNSLKMYDKGSVLRVETAVNNPSEFKRPQVESNSGDDASLRWVPMRKGVANAWWYTRVCRQVNGRYLEALGQAQPQGKTIEELDGLCRSTVKNGKRFAKFHPIAAEDCQLFAAAIAGEHTIPGFRNADLQARLYDGPASCPEERRRRSARTCRLIAKLRAHGLIRKVKDARLYQVTGRGYRLMAAALRCRNSDFPRFAQEALALDAA